MYSDKECRYILSYSGGKDSSASVILAHIHNEPLDEIITSEVMFDKKKGYSAENPEHMAFIKEVAKPLFESWGYKVSILHSEKDYLDVFHHTIEKPRSIPEHKGMRRGFITAGTCALKRDCKVKPIDDYLKRLRKKDIDIIQYLGIATDEPVRLNAMHKDPYMISLLEKYELTESDARILCEAYGLLSPAYKYSKRQGCWCCPYAKDAEHIAAMKAIPDAVKEYIALENVNNKVYNRWNTKTRETLKERFERLAV